MSSSVQSLLDVHSNVHTLSRETLIQAVIDSREAFVSPSGALVTWNPKAATGRIPKDTYMVKDAVTKNTVDWSSAFCNAMTVETFDALWGDALAVLQSKSHLYVGDRSVGADPTCTLAVRTMSDSPLSVLFADTMFRPSADTSVSVLGSEPFTLLVLPYDAVDTVKHKAVLREDKGKTVPILLAMDFERRLGIVYGTCYSGCIKKTLFTVMNYLLPAKGVLPLHASANQGADGTSAVFLGLSGTGKTTLSTDPARPLIGDDEMSWTSSGIGNLENGCYAKLINLRQDKEPEIHRAVFAKRPTLDNGCIIENAMYYPRGEFDLTDDRLTENSRAAYPLRFLENTVPTARSGHPKTIIFLTADASGVLPPVAKLNPGQAMLWFMMAYTSKLAGTEVGVVAPTPNFSRFFGGPFMPRHPRDYTELFGKNMKEHGSEVFLVNTGWSGGAYGTGKRMDIALTRSIVTAALKGELSGVPLRRDVVLKLDVPTSCPGVEATLLDPRSTWADASAYEKAALELATRFAAHFEKEYGKAGLPAEVEAACPGRLL